jgi:hypothetical protein
MKGFTDMLKYLKHSKKPWGPEYKPHYLQKKKFKNTK